MKPNILIIAGTVRQGRVGRKIADWYMSEAEKLAPGATFELLDIAELDLPIFSDQVPPLFAEGNYSEKQQQLADRISAVDGYVIVTSEYNHSIPGSLNNALDHLTPREWRRKPVAYVGYGIAGASTAISHLMDVMIYLQATNLVQAISISTVWEALDDQGAPKPGYMRGDVKTQLDELLWWAKALKTARDQSG